MQSITSMFTIAAAALLVVGASAAEQAVKLKDLPAAVQKAIPEQTKGATVVGYAKEVEDGKTFYEIETKVNGKTRDLLMDPTGAVTEVEEEVALDSIPAAARAAIQSRAGKGKITKVESVTKDGNVTYEAAISKAGKKSEIAVAADGTTPKK
jgi:uncharacterized membrane protein YkoI